MSYILDALRRAEADRQRGAVPGLQDQPQPLPAPAAAPADGPRRTGLWALAGAGLLAAGGAAAWWWLKLPGPAPVAPVAVMTPAPAVAPTALPAPVTPVAPAAAPVLVAPAPAVVSSMPAAAPAPASPALVLPPIPPQPAEPAAPAEPAKKPAPRPAVAAAPAPAPDAVRRQDLPENVRQQLPALTVAGATYSENPRYRMVIINGQVVQEGDTAAPGVVLEAIRQKEVVLRAQGYRFTEKY